MSVYRVTLSLDVDFSGDTLKYYLEQLNDHEDTESQRRWFASDLLINESDLCLLHPDYNLTVEKVEAMSDKVWQYVVTTTYSIHANDDKAADAGLAWVMEHGEFGDNVTVTDQVVARFDPPKQVPGDAWFWNDKTLEWEKQNDY